MRIAYICMDPGIPVFGRKGASVHVQGVLAALRRAGHDIVLFAARLGDDPPAWSDAILVRHVQLPRADASRRGAAWIEGANAALREALANEGAFDAIYERYSLWSHAGMTHAREAHIPGILEVNAPLIEEATAHRGLGSADRCERVHAERVAATCFECATSIVAVSDEVADYVNAHPRRTARAVVEANGYDPERFPPIARATHEPFTLGFLGTLKPWHGVELLADILLRVRASISDARLLVIGDGPERESLRRRLVDYGLEANVRFAGAVLPADVAGWLAHADVALAPYPADVPFYFSPLKVVEYMAAGVPVVASALGQIPTLVRHGVTGLLAPPGDAAAFADAVLALHAADEWRRRMGEAAREAALAERTWDAVVARILSRAEVYA